MVKWATWGHNAINPIGLKYDILSERYFSPRSNSCRAKKTSCRCAVASNRRKARRTCHTALGTPYGTLHQKANCGFFFSKLVLPGQSMRINDVLTDLVIAGIGTYSNKTCVYIYIYPYWVLCLHFQQDYLIKKYTSIGDFLVSNHASILDTLPEKLPQLSQPPRIRGSLAAQPGAHKRWILWRGSQQFFEKTWPLVASGCSSHERQLKC